MQDYCKEFREALQEKDLIQLTVLLTSQEGPQVIPLHRLNSTEIVLQILIKQPEEV